MVRSSSQADYLAKNLPKMEGETAQELESEIKAELKKSKNERKKGGRRPSTVLILGNCTVHASSKGDKITIVGLTKSRQTQLLEALKGWLSQ